jgi:para-nitrobenzyl esterase
MPAVAGFFGKGEHYGMTVDGWLLPETPRAVLEAGKLASVPLLLGTTQDEATMFTAKIPLRREAGLKRIAAKLFPSNADEVVAMYPVASYGSVKAAFDALVTDLVFGCPTRMAARKAHPPQVYRYLFSHVTDAMKDTGLGATHASEIPYVFGTLSAPTADERALSKIMLGYWTRFAHGGDPNGPGLPAWPAHDARDAYLELATPAVPRAGLRTQQCDLLDRLVLDGDLEEDD